MLIQGLLLRGGIDIGYGYPLVPFRTGPGDFLGSQKLLDLLCRWQLARGVPNRGRECQMPGTEGLRTQSFLQGLDVAPLRPALPPDLVVGASVAETRACAAARLDAIALQFPLPANHARQTLWLRHARVAPRGSLHRDVVLVLEVVGRVRHHDGVGRRLG